MAHIKRGDVLVHYAQTLLQILYWWHPLLWLANARIRHVREQAVDEMVMVEMGGEAEAYPATLLEVAKLALQRPILALGLIGIVESRSALAQRIKHLLERPVPESARLGFAGLAIVFLAGALLLPMARAERNPNAEATESAQARPPGAPTGDNVSESARDNLTVAITKTGQRSYNADRAGNRR
jgi:beta-lactamase regulating signal transducer with metallopeptidase domain